MELDPRSDAAADVTPAGPAVEGAPSAVDAVEVRRLRRGARRAQLACAAVAFAFVAADGSLLGPAAWSVLAGAACWFALGLRRVAAACRAADGHRVARRVALHVLPLLVTAAAAPALAVLHG